ncbi:MAG: hypothetical protein IJW20_00395 [Clostridia bacterium]|nr:hypothetical protein [Clostridia bacterium]
MKKEELKKYFEELNYDESLQNEILAYVDNEKDIESLYEKIKFLTKTGVPQEGIEMIINENPLFLTTTLETVKNNINFLKNIKLENIARTLEINPELLSTSDKTMSENYKLLKILMSEKDLMNMLKVDCEILTFNTDYFEKRLEFFIKNDLKDQIKDIILNDIEAFEDEEDEIDLEDLKAKYKK